MDRAAPNTAGHIADVVGDVGGAEIQALVGEPSCHSLDHFGASHSAALSSLAPARALVLAKVHASAIAAMLRSRELSAIAFTVGYAT
ncbi:stage V sporulation protein SpoVS [Bradyrhizobium diazoefficiens]